MNLKDKIRAPYIRLKIELSCIFFKSNLQNVFISLIDFGNYGNIVITALFFITDNDSKLIRYLTIWNSLDITYFTI